MIPDVVFFQKWYTLNVVSHLKPLSFLLFTLSCLLDLFSAATQPVNTPVNLLKSLLFDADIAESGKLANDSFKFLCEYKIYLT